ncbi:MULTISPECIES: LysM peptidoglycan-binding domain-containing protein [Sphingobacterium]|uniref:Membrane-bound lytic murein transglycosylase D n=2 Tax=Sphingobacterium TaxID=28453 RepID=A0A420ACC5_SPHD1|nr:MULTISPECIES: LysM peptidoglycan-binding domain-containing protein [Sphingobacterium]MCS4227618.1 membrane-bound lytic murein transglycosylase D [Sphingobacterium sp. BIGb0165]RKE42109.1 membrane-bound lytic murein transglycosylase D [Sphingobacterium detergens]
MIGKQTLISILGGLCYVLPIMAQESAVEGMREATHQVIQGRIDREKQEIYQYLDSVKSSGNSRQDDSTITEEEIQLVRKLKAIEREVPLNYSPQVKNLISKYTSNNYNPYMCRMMGLGQYYFPMFDRIMDEVGVPRELKYLSVVESSLNPRDISSAGATGLWQLMYYEAKTYNLTVDSYTDQRMDPIASSYAIAKILKEAYDEYGDWLLAIASYNGGKGAVGRAIQRSGKDKPTFWDIAPYLTQQTQNYIPKFIAMTYAMKYAEENDINAADTELSLRTQALDINKRISLNQIAAALDVSKETLRALNPSFKKNILNGTEEAPLRLVLPVLDKKIATEELYAALNTPIPTSVMASSGTNEPTELLKDGKYKVKVGETFASVAEKFEVTVQDIKSWNNLRGNKIVPGQNLLIKKEDNFVNAKLAHNAEKSVKKSQQRAASRTAYYVVKKGDTLSQIADKNGVSVSRLKSDNDLNGSRIKPGMKLKVSKK